MWLKAFVISVCLYALMVTYAFFYAGHIEFAQISESLAGTGGFLIGTSFALSGMSYFFDFMDKRLSYRKFLGVFGVFYALLYSITLVVRFPEKYDFFYPQSFLTAEAILGLSAMTILTTMALISNATATRLLGPKLWRRILHSGYIAYVLLIIRAVIVEHEIWQAWFDDPSTLPPPRLVLTIFASCVLILRFCMEISLRLRKKPSPPPLQPAVNTASTMASPMVQVTPPPPTSPSVSPPSQSGQTPLNQ
jgi:DMSO/TMAO reductase YedYZ heme-binding membrane subunit